MAIFATFFVGLLVGLLTWLLRPRGEIGDLIITALLGIAGSFLAAFVGKGTGWYTSGDPLSILASAIGAGILLGTHRLLFKPRRRR